MPRPSSRRHEGVVLSSPLLWLLQPLAPLLTCTLLALFAASLTAAMRSAASERLDENGRLVNASTLRRFLHEVRPALATGGGARLEEGATNGCTVLTNETAKSLCTDLAAGFLSSFSVGPAAHRLQHCNVFDFRLLLVHADSLTPAPPGVQNCSSLLLTEQERGHRVNESRCLACLSVLIKADKTVAEMAQLFYNTLAKYQCNTVRDDATSTSSLRPIPPSASLSIASSTSSPAHSSALSRRSNDTELAPFDRDVNTDLAIEVPMNPHTDAGSSNCAACRAAYSGWLCTKKFRLYPFSTMSSMSPLKRFLAVEACPNWCAAVETACPYFTPGEEAQNGGEPVFLCDEAHYHHSSHYRVPSDPCEQDSRRHTCCYTRQDTDCRPLNKTCPSMTEVCSYHAPSAAPSGVTTDSTINTSTSSPLPSSQLQRQRLQKQQQLQYLAQSQNVTLDTNATSPSSQATRAAACGPLLLTTCLLLASCSLREARGLAWTSLGLS